jgi:hypothetical protein
MFTLIELQLMRQSLDVITIVGKDAKTVATLQTKLEQVLEEEAVKQQQLQQTLAKNKK